MERKDGRVEAAGCSDGGTGGVLSQHFLEGPGPVYQGLREVMDSCFLAYGRVQLNSLLADFNMPKYHLEAGRRGEKS